MVKVCCRPFPQTLAPLGVMLPPCPAEAVMVKVVGSDRRTAAAGGGELYVVHKDGATILAICGTLITEGQLRGIARHFNCHISGSNIAIDNTIGSTH